MINFINDSLINRPLYTKMHITHNYNFCESYYKKRKEKKESNKKKRKK